MRMLCICCTAFCGTTSALLRSTTCTRTRPNWPGRSVCLGLGKRACNSSVPVLGSTWLSAFSTRPVKGYSRFVGQDEGDAAGCRAATACPLLTHERYSDSVTLKRTQIGSSGTMVVSGCGELGVTRPPTGTSVSPMRPSMGE